MNRKARPRRQDFGSFGYYRIAAISPPLFLAEPARNAQTIHAWTLQAEEREVCAAVFPELSITGYSCEDLFHSQSLLIDARRGLADLAHRTTKLQAAVVVGSPYQTRDGRLYNCAFVLHRGSVLGAVPKVHLPNHGEFYERRWFVSGGDVDVEIEDDILGRFRLGTRQLFQIGDLVFAVEICEDLWAPVPVSGDHALAGANLVFNLSASNDIVAKADYRRELVKTQSARLNAAYAYVSSGPFESTKDIVYGGHALIAENGSMLAEGSRFDLKGSIVTAEVDVEKLAHERAHNITFGASPAPRPAYRTYRIADTPRLSFLERTYPRTPFVPDDPSTVNERAREILEIQSTGLARRLLASRSENAVIGISGGLDSTLALLVSVEAMRRLGRPASRVLALSMPGFGTTPKTRGSASSLAKCLKVSFREVSIEKAVLQHFRDLEHDSTTLDLVYENAQARERTQILFDTANQRHGIVVGTGDLSELALGWCTYNADHMANYAVNVSVPKTLVRHLVRWYAQHVADADARKILEAILATPISPELLPPRSGGRVGDDTERLIGPYVLHDFFLFQYLRNGFGPRKIFILASRAFDKEFEIRDIKKWMKVFFERFFRNQFKRTCLPPGPKVGSVTLSPRGDLRLPDEVDPASFLLEIDAC